MTWPQAVILTLLVLQCAGSIATPMRDRSKSSGAVTVSVFVAIGWVFGYAAVLHAGGFW